MPEAAAAGAGRFFVVINHYAGANAPAYLAQSTLFSASLSMAAESVGAVMVVDGSDVPEAALAAQLTAIGANYTHAGRRLSFAEGYNAGLALSDRPWTVLCASDIYPSLSLYPALDAACAAAGADVGCFIPRLTTGDLGLQRVAGQARRAVDVPLMTLNFNVMRTDYLRAIGGVPSEFQGCYNDVLMSRRIAADGKVVRMLPEQCLHYGSLTLKSGGSNVSFDRDAAQLRTTYPELWREHGLWHLNLRALSDDAGVRAVERVTRLLPKSLRWPAADRLLAELIRRRMR